LIERTVNAPDADVAFVSSDQPIPVHFHIHSKNLEVSTGAFPPARKAFSPSSSSALVAEEAVPLSEPAEVLEVLFTFMYPNRHPNLENVTFSLLAQVAESAEKYEVYPAISICKVRMK
jgi:hypothetical protein